MKNLVWSSTFVRAFKRLVRQNPQLRFQVEETLQKLIEEVDNAENLGTDPRLLKEVGDLVFHNWCQLKLIGF